MFVTASTTVKFHEFPSGKVLHNYKPGTQADSPIRSISWSKDGNWLALVPSFGLTEIVSLKENHLKLIHTINAIEEPSCASFQKTTKKNLALGTKSGQVLLYDMKARSVKKRFPRATATITHLEYTAKDTHIVGVSASGEGYIYSNVHNNLSGTFKVPRSDTISAMRTNPIKKNYIVAGSDEGVVAVWDINLNKHKFFIGSHQACVTAVAFSPINSEFVVSTGLDRQFCFYDVGEHKCIRTIFVENSMTCIDFTPDGQFVIMASQNGNVFIYDIKNVKQPVHTFCAHTSPIEQLLFRKTEDFDSSFNISGDKVDATVESRTSDSFNFDRMVHTEPSTAPTQRTPNMEDSFMAAMGLDSNNTVDSEKHDRSSKIHESIKNSSIHKYTPMLPSKRLQELAQSGGKSHFHSTPDYTGPGTSPQMSPIGDYHSPALTDQSKTATQNIEQFVKSAVKDEMKAVAEQLTNDIKYYSNAAIGETRHMFLSLLMEVVKEFIKMENNLNGLRSELLVSGEQQREGSAVSAITVVEENFFLRQKIAALEDEVEQLKNELNKNG